MKQSNSFLKVLDKTEKKIQLMSEQIKAVRFLYKCDISAKHMTKRCSLKRPPKSQFY